MRKSLFLYCKIVVILCGCNTITSDPPKKTITGTNQFTENDWALLPFYKIDSANPVLRAGNGVFTCPVLKKNIKWENKDVFNPAIVVKNGIVYMLYRAEDTIGKYAGTSRIGLAESSDGIHFKKRSAPVLYPSSDEQKKYEWEGGCEDPRIVEDANGRYYMTYSAYDGDKARLLVASSNDLVHWTKHGPAFAKAYNGKYLNTWSKSGSIVSTYEKDGRIIATPINGKYWMYWGDVNVWAAVSDDLINWAPVLYTNNEKPSIELRHNAKDISEIKTVFGPRKKKFDSDLVEPGPPAMLTDKGILLIYNSRNIPSIGDSLLAEGTYAPSQILLNPADPTTVLYRMENYFMKPEKPYEITGQVNRVCFVEGLAWFKNSWFLYYGTADSKIAVAIKK